jgi:MYXO-CTERM domain-containing protein
MVAHTLATAAVCLTLVSQAAFAQQAAPTPAGAAPAGQMVTASPGSGAPASARTLSVAPSPPGAAHPIQWGWLGLLGLGGLLRPPRRRQIRPHGVFP